MISSQNQPLRCKIAFFGNVVYIVSELGRSLAGIATVLIHLVTGRLNQQRTFILFRLRESCFKY
jgi:thiamine monophosphate kinase